MLARRVAVLGSLLCVVLSAAAGCGDSGTSSGGGGSSSETSSSSGGNGGGGGNPSGPVTVLTWNLYNFFDTTEDTSNSSEDSQSQADYDTKLNAVVSKLSEINPDVMILVEVENEGILDDINDALGGEYITREISEGNDPRGVDIAAMAKFPFSKVVTHAEEKFLLEGTNAPTYTYSRDCPEYHFQIGDQKVVFLGVHFKAKGPPDNPEKRLAEAQHTRAIADFLFSQDNTLAIGIMGDFNDLPGSPPVNAVLNPDPAYIDVTQFAPLEDQWSFNFQGAKELIDHMMVNPVLSEKLDQSSVAIPHDTVVSQASDHAPIVATFNF
jgi:endonuclease/exonuclease/phosphatase family metal-dependent hydrolase